MTRPALLIITVNWNAGTQLADCLKSCLAAKKPCSTNIVVVDNLSSDGSEKIVEEFAAFGYPVSLVRAGENLGFAEGCNFGVRHARECGHDPDFILFLNPDTRLELDSLVKLFDADCVRDPEVGIIGVQLRDAYGIATSCSHFPSALNFWCKNTGLDQFLVHQSWAQHHMRGFDHLSSRDVDQVMGAFLMIRAALFDRLEGFDSRFFVYFEEVDLCLRAKRSGFRVWFESSSHVWHEGQGTTNSVKGFRLYLSVSSRLRYFWKNHGKLNFASILILSFLIEPIARIVRLMSRGRFSELKELSEAYGFFIKNGIK